MNRIKDKLFLLSRKEVEKYLINTGRLNAYSCKDSVWWLRSPSNIASYACCNDDLIKNGRYLITRFNAVRPALHLNSKYLQSLNQINKECILLSNRKWIVLDEKSGLILAEEE